MTHVAIIADDLTGATDSAALFAQKGFSTSISLTRIANYEADVISISTDSRDIPVDVAVDRVRCATASIAELETEKPILIYKKLDSALRGHLRAELLATMTEAGMDRAVVSPALPSEERTTRNGRQYILGVPLEESSFGHLGISSDIVATLRGCDVRFPVTLVTRGDLRALGPAAFERPGIFVADARTDDDLDLIAKHARRTGVPLLAGSAGLARAIVRTSRWRPAVQLPTQPRMTRAPILVIAGTMHGSTAKQIDFAAAHGIAVMRPDQPAISDPKGSIAAFAQEVQIVLAAGHDVIATTSGLAQSDLGPFVVADRMSQLIDFDSIRDMVGGVMLTGGDVAAAVCSRLGATAIGLRGEVLPAIPWGFLVDGRAPGLLLVTKAGSFGTPRTILSCVEHLKAANLQRRN